MCDNTSHSIIVASIQMRHYTHQTVSCTEYKHWGSWRYLSNAKEWLLNVTKSVAGLKPWPGAPKPQASSLKRPVETP